MDKVALQKYLDSFKTDSVQSKPLDPKATYVSLEDEPKAMTTIVVC